MTRLRQGILKGNAGSAYSRWQMPSVGTDAPGVSAAEAGNTQPLTAMELESLQRQAYDEGFAAGRGDGFLQGKREGLDAAASECRSQVDRLQAILRCLAAPLESLDEEVERSLAALAVAIARQVVRRELAARPEQIVAVVHESLEALPTAARHVTLHLHPDDVALVNEVLCEEIENAQWVMREDATLDRGGCRVESDSSRIDASVAHRLACVIAQVLDGEGADAPVMDEA
nr:flagellar assembly protein FliH [Gammaproteobacteria bacterium]